MTRGRRLPLIPALLLFALATQAPAGAEGHEALLERARAFFQEFTATEQAYDPAVADFYADDARIVIVQTGGGGERREVTMSGAQYKHLARKLIAVSKAAGGAAAYADASYAVEGGLVRIRATRYIASMESAAPYSILVGPTISGRWLIHQEVAIAP